MSPSCSGSDPSVTAMLSAINVQIFKCPFSGLLVAGELDCQIGYPSRATKIRALPHLILGRDFVTQFYQVWVYLTRNNVPVMLGLVLSQKPKCLSQN